MNKAMEIVICPNCNGWGKVDEGFHDAATFRTCDRCGGNGLLKKTITFERYQPGVPLVATDNEATETASFLRRVRAWLDAMPKF